MTNDYLSLMSRYNRWMNENLFSVCAGVPDDERRRDRGASYRSIHGTLNHLLLADRLWLARFLDRPYTVASLDQELYADFETLRVERAVTDDEIDAWVQKLNALSEEDWLRPLAFDSMTTGSRAAMPLRQCVIHFFNHQTHHRGQLTTLLHQAGFEFGPVDLMWLPYSPASNASPPAPV